MRRRRDDRPSGAVPTIGLGSLDAGLADGDVRGLQALPMDALTEAYARAQQAALPEPARPVPEGVPAD